MLNITNQSPLSVVFSIVIAIAIVVGPFGLMQAQEYQAVEKRLKKAVKKGEITQKQSDQMMSTLRGTAPENSHDLPALHRAFSSNVAIIQSTFNRMKDEKIEADHFQRLNESGIETLDVALDAQRRRTQSRIALNTSLRKNTEIWNLLKLRLQEAIVSGELTKQEADRRLKMEEKKLLDLKTQLGEEMTDEEERDDSWLARRNLEAATSARKAALETWRIVKKQLENGAATNVQQMAQVSEQYYFFNAMVIEACNNTIKAERRSEQNLESDSQ